MRRRWLSILVGIVLLLLGLGGLAAPGPVAAVTCTWTGATSTDWGATGNWSGCNGLGGDEPPAAADSVTVGSAGNQPTISGASVTIASLALTGGATLTIAGDGTLTVDGDISLAADGGATATIDNAGTVVATGGTFATNSGDGSAVEFVIGSSGIWTLQNISTSSNTTLSLLGSPTVHVKGNITRTGGTFNPGTSSIIFDSGGTQSLSGGSQHYFYNLEIDRGTTLNHESGSGAIRVRNNFTNNGTFSQTSGDSNRRLQFDYSLSYPTSNLAGSGTTNAARIVIASSKTVNAGDHSITINNNGTGRIPWDNGGTFNGGTGTVTFNGNSTSAIAGAGTNNFHNVLITGVLNAGGAGLNVAGDWTNNGTFGAGTSTVTFNKAGTSAYGGASTTTFNNVVVSGGTTLDVGTNALFSATGSVTNDGTLRQSKTVSGATVSFLNVTDGASTAKYYGVDISTANDLGSTTVAVSGNQTCTQANGYPVSRCFEISPASAASSDITFYFRDAELQTGQTLTSLKIWHYNGSTWDEVTKGATGDLGGGNLYVQGTGISSFSPFVLKNTDPLAVTVEMLSAVAHGDSIVLTWETVSELDLRGFNLYRSESREGPWGQRNPTLIPGRRPGSPQGNSYRWEDRDISPGTYYVYRLEAIALDGTSSTVGITEVTASTGVRLWLPLLRRG